MGKRNIILIGFMGTGKTTIGEALATQLDWQPIDVDQYIEQQQQMKISALFETFGEPHFRQLETEALAAILKGQQQVVMSGGGAPIKDENKQLMLEGGLVIHLHATAEEIIERVRQDTSRPLLQGNLSERVHTLLEERKNIYQFAPIQIDTTEQTIEQIVTEIVSIIKKEA